MTELLRHLDMTIELLRRSHPKHLLLRELEKRATLVRLHFEDVKPASPDNVRPIRRQGLRDRCYRRSPARTMSSDKSRW